MFRLSQADASSNIIDKLTENAKKFGVVLPLEFAKEQSDRENIISQLLVSMPDSLVAQYFTDFLIVHKIPWPKTRDLMLKALAAPASGGNVEQVLNYALKHYTRKYNYNQTKEIIEGGLKLQNTSRNINIFNVLSDALDNKAPSIGFVGFAPDSAADVFALNKLVALSLNKNEGALEMLRREFIKSLDELENIREIDDRTKAITQTLESIEFNTQLTNIVKFCTEVFKISMNDRVLLAFRRLIVQLKLGLEFRTQIFSDLESTKTSPLKRDTSPDPGQDEILLKTLRETFGPRASTNSFIKVADIVPPPGSPSLTPPGTAGSAATPPSGTPAAGTTPAAAPENAFSEFLRGAQEALKGLQGGIGNIPTITSRLGIPPDKQKQLDDAIKGITDQIGTLAKGLEELKVKVDTGVFTDPQKALEEFLKIWDPITEEIKKQIAKIPENLPAILQKGEDGLKSLAKQLNIKEEIVLSPLGIAISSFGIASGLSGDLKGVLGSVLTLLAADENLARLNSGKSLGRPVPKAKNIGINPDDLEAAFRSMGANQDQLNTLISLDKYATSVKATIADREQTLLKRMTTEVKTSTGSNIDAPLAENKEIQREYSRFYVYLREANLTMSYYLDLISTLVQQFRMNPDNEKLLLAKTGPALQRRAQIEALVVDVRSKLAKYKSFTIIADNVQKRSRLIMDLQVLVPELEKYMASGISIADLFLQPNGLRDKLKEMSDSLVQDRDRLYKEIQKTKESRKPIIKKLPSTLKRPKQTLTPQTNISSGINLDTPEYLGDNPEQAIIPFSRPR